MNIYINVGNVKNKKILLHTYHLYNNKWKTVDRPTEMLGMFRKTIETSLMHDAGISGFLGDSVVPCDMFLETVLRKDVFLKQTRERMLC